MELGSRKLLLHYGRVVMLLKKRFGKVLALGLYFLFLTLWSSSVSGAERREHGNLLFRWFKSQEYKGSEQNWAIVQDQRGLLYVGNNEGGVKSDCSFVVCGRVGGGLCRACRRFRSAFAR